ncbi:DUF3310 domain-containing protein [Staphylococcus cohnii]|uniref:DUF3310 domain-containing protein n=1 Tax=Staphylococcus cohnii TaxID=29382 RepID=UPI003D7CABE9
MMNNLKQGDWVQYVNEIGQSEYGKYIKSIVKMHKLKTVMELEKIDGVHVYIDENTDCIRIPAEWAEELEKRRKEKIKEAQEMLVGINDVYEKEYNQSNDLQQRKRKDNVNSPSHYMLGNHEVKDIVSLVADKYHKGSVAHNIASALEYQMRAPEKNGLEDIKEARKCLDFAIENWDVK